MAPPYMRPMGPTATAAILCGDPARALTIAQRVLVEPRMSNHHRGLWGYHGSTARGEELSVQATGIGGPSAALVLTLLAERGLRRAIRVGSCRSLDPGPPLGSRLLATSVLARDGASVAYGAQPGARLPPDRELSGALMPTCDGKAELISLDRPVVRGVGPHADADADEGGGTPPAVGSSPEGSRITPVYDMQSAALLAAAEGCGVRLAIAVVLSRSPEGPLPDEPHESAALELAESAAVALAPD